VVLLEGELAAIKEEDRQRSRLLGDMAAQRDRCAAQAGIDATIYVFTCCDEVALAFPLYTSRM
jgi:hypothetical protein